MFASLLIGVACPLRTASQLALVAGVVAYDTVDKLMGEASHPEILLKWPNDVMLEEAKVAGMLLESAERKVSNGTMVVIGTGINIVRHPEGLTVPATSLAAHGVACRTH